MSEQNKIDDGEPAFPVHPGQGDKDLFGMTLRDWFAGKALQAQLSMRETWVAIAKGDVTADQVCGSCYQFADAMIAAQKGGAK